MNVEEVCAIVVDESYRLHRGLGPGLLESVYEVVLARVLARRGLSVQRQKMVRFQYDGLTFEDGLRIDLLVEGSLVVELKSAESIAAAHTKQLLTYLRLLDLPLGLLINFGAPTFKSGVKRVVNRHTDTASSTLHIHSRSGA
jgi:GxxExxY protein